MVDKNKELNDLSKIFAKLAKSLDKNAKSNDKILDLSSTQLKSIKKLLSGDITKPVDDFMDTPFFDPKRGYRKALKESEKERQDFLDEQIDKEEELAKKKQDSSSDELKAMMKKMDNNKRATRKEDTEEDKKKTEPEKKSKKK